MIDSNFIIRYTTALYSCPAEYCPRYDEFRDMFSRGQIHSKEWVIRELDFLHENRSFIIVGSWFGTLGLMIKNHFPDSMVTMIDIDPRCARFVKEVNSNNSMINAITGDMYKYNYTEDVIINTSCEHISDIESWVKLIPPGKIVVLQSNNARNIQGHINCVDSELELAEMAGLSNILYSGHLEMPMYTRFMVIGEV